MQFAAGPDGSDFSEDQTKFSDVCAYDTAKAADYWAKGLGGSQEFIRVRMGVGRKPRPDYDLADWVLGKPAAEDRKAIDARYPDAEAACRLLMAGKLAEAQNKYNH